jgi:hypothetical protein
LHHAIHNHGSGALRKFAELVKGLFGVVIEAGASVSARFSAFPLYAY